MDTPKICIHGIIIDGITVRCTRHWGHENDHCGASDDGVFVNVGWTQNMLWCHHDESCEITLPPAEGKSTLTWCGRCRVHWEMTQHICSSCGVVGPYAPGTTLCPACDPRPARPS